MWELISGFDVEALGSWVCCLGPRPWMHEIWHTLYTMILAITGFCSASFPPVKFGFFARTQCARFLGKGTYDIMVLRNFVGAPSFSRS